jgi:hypothetical protein
MVPCEAFSKGFPRAKKSLTQLVGGNAQSVGRKAIAFSCSEPGNFRLVAGSQTFCHKLFQAARSLYRPGVQATAVGLSPVLDRLSSQKLFIFQMFIPN